MTTGGIIAWVGVALVWVAFAWILFGRRKPKLQTQEKPTEAEKHNVAL